MSESKESDQTTEQPPLVNGVQAQLDPAWDPKGLFAQVGFCAWLCPHCHAHLSTNKICLNGCGLSAPAFRRLQRLEP